MDHTTAIVVCLGFLVVALVIVLLSYRSRGKGKIKGPWGMGVEVEGSNEGENQPCVSVKDAEAKGNIRATDATGKGVHAERLKSGADIEVSSSPPPKT